jgi:hypothetical protein
MQGGDLFKTFPYNPVSMQGGDLFKTFLYNPVSMQGGDLFKTFLYNLVSIQEGDLFKTFLYIYNRSVQRKPLICGKSLYHIIFYRVHLTMSRI